MAETRMLVGTWRRSEWLAATVRAMAVSLAAVAASIVVVSSVFVALQAKQLRMRESTSVTHCLISEDGQRATALWWNVPTTLQGWTHCVTVYATDPVQPSRNINWPNMSPACMTAGASDDDLFIGDWDGAVYSVRNAALGGQPRLIGQHTDGVLELQASNDGRYLISLSPSAMCAWDLTTNRLLWQRAGGQVSRIAVHPDSSWLVCGMNDGSACMHNMHDGCVVRDLLANPPPWPVHDLDFTPDGRTLAIAHATGDVRLVSAFDEEADADGAEQTEPFCVTGWPRLARFSACGTLLMTTAPGNSPELVVWNVSSGQQAAILNGHTGLVLGAQFTRDGRLFSWGSDATIRIWDVERGQELRVLSLAPADQRRSWPRTFARLGSSARAHREERAG